MNTENTMAIAAAGSITTLSDHRPRRAGFAQPEKLQADAGPAPELSLLPDMSHTNGRGAIEIINRTLQTY